MNSRQEGSSNWKRPDGDNLRNPCLTMHQPWASLLIHGIKRIEGRSWPAPLRGRLWIHAAAKVPDPETIEAMENFYRELYKVEGITDLKFPEHYPVSSLLGTVDVVGCVKLEELKNYDNFPVSVRLEGQTEFCWLCEDPKKLVVPFEMRGWQGVYNLEKKTAAAAVKGLRPYLGPAPIKFSLLHPSNSRLGSLDSAIKEHGSSSNLPSSQSLNASIAGARGAAKQFQKKHEPLKQAQVQLIPPRKQSVEFGSLNSAIEKSLNLAPPGSLNGLPRKPQKQVWTVVSSSRSKNQAMEESSK